VSAAPEGARDRPDSPYRGLAPFGDGDLDALLFFGRERERELIAANLMASPLTILYGPSGAGKTSVLRAGVAHDLRRTARERAGERPPDLAVVVVDAWRDDPVQATLDAVAAELTAVAGDDIARTAAGADGLTSAITAWTRALEGDLYIVLDQFDEYLLYHESEEGEGTFARELPEALNQPGLRVGFLVSLREDQLARLDRFKGRIPGLFANSLRLDRLTREAARSAIVGPLERFAAVGGNGGPSRAEPELVEAVLDEVAAAEPGGRATVEAPYLQLVMQRVWHAEAAAGSDVLRLETLRELGGAGRVIHGHLEDAVAELAPAERDVAASVFNHLVTPSGTKIAHGVADLAAYASIDPGELVPVLSTLAEARILRPVAAADGSGETRYEIFHDVLGEPIRDWRRAHAEDRRLEGERTEARRRHRRLLWVVAAALLGLAVAVGLAVFALTQRSEAREQARLSQSRELAASALGALGSDPELGLLVALQAARAARTPEAENALREALIASRVRRVLTGHEGPVRHASFSPDGQFVLTAGPDGTARLVDLQGSGPPLVLRHDGPVTSASFSPDGASVLTSSADGTARVWSVPDGAAFATYRHGGKLRGSSFGPDGELVLTWGDDGTARIWRGSFPTLILRHGAPVSAAAIDAGGDVVVTGGEDAAARLFEAHSGKLLFVLPHEKPVTGVDFSPDGTLLVTAGRERIARIWSVETGELVHELAEHRGMVTSASFSPNGEQIVTTSNDGGSRIWDVATGLRTVIFLGHANAVMDAAFSRDGEHVVTVSSDRSARVWEASTGRPEVALLGHTELVNDAAFDLDGTSVVTASEDGTARVWDASPTELAEPLTFLGSPTRALFTPDGRFVFASAAKGRARLLDAETGAVVRFFETVETSTSAISPDGSLVATAGDGELLLWQLETGMLLDRLPLIAPAAELEFSPDGTRLLAAGVDGRARILELRSGEQVRELRGPDTPLNDASFSADGSLIATASEDGTAQIWNAETGDPVRQLRGHTDGVLSVAFSPDGTRVVTSSRDGDARTWDAVTGQPLRLLRGHFGWVSEASFSPDGRWVVTAGPASTGLWDADSGRLVFLIRGYSGLVTGAVFDPTGQRILTSSDDDRIRLYVCEICGSIDELVALAEQRLAQIGRQLTAEERRELHLE
jgi:WD40 repeat protein